MENREKLLNALIEMESLPTTFWRETVCRNWRNALTTAEFDLPVGSRQARRECGYYDTLFTEIHDNRNAEKAKARRQRSDARKHKELPKDRKRNREMRKDRLYGYYYGECIKVAGHPDSLPINHRREAESVRIICSDWETEQLNHAETMQEIRNLEDMAEGLYYMAEEDTELSERDRKDIVE